MMSHILKLREGEEAEIGEPIIAEIYRHDPFFGDEPRMERFVVPYGHRMSIFTLLREIYERQEPSLAFRNQQCGRGICGTCQVRVRINSGKGQLVKGCSIPLPPGTHITILPYSERRVIRDLVVDF